MVGHNGEPTLQVNSIISSKINQGIIFRLVNNTDSSEPRRTFM